MSQKIKIQHFVSITAKASRTKQMITTESFFFFIRERERGEEWKSRLLDLSKKWIRKRERERVKDIEVEKEPYNIFTDLNSMRAE